jgi:hypothetical protein
VKEVAPTPFVFTACVELRQTLQRTAHDARELMERLREAPDDAVLFHVHGYFLRHRPFTIAYGNDFARWAAVELADMALGERLAVVDPFQYGRLSELREALVAIIGSHAATRPGPRVEFQRAFHFQRSRMVLVPVGPPVGTLAEFRQGLAAVDASAIYHHMVEARARASRPRSDFAEWVGTALDLADLATQIERIDLYLTTPERVRGRLLLLVDQALEAGAEDSR